LLHLVHLGSRCKTCGKKQSKGWDLILKKRVYLTTKKKWNLLSSPLRAQSSSPSPLIAAHYHLHLRLFPPPPCQSTLNIKVCLLILISRILYYCYKIQIHPFLVVVFGLYTEISSIKYFTNNTLTNNSSNDDDFFYHSNETTKNEIEESDDVMIDRDGDMHLWRWRRAVTRGEGRRKLKKMATYIWLIYYSIKNYSFKKCERFYHFLYISNPSKPSLSLLQTLKQSLRWYLEVLISALIKLEKTTKLISWENFSRKILHNMLRFYTYIRLAC